MEKRIVGGVEFTILDNDEVQCNHEFPEVVYYESVLVNPNGEYVVGYGHEPVFVRIEHKRPSALCVKCGFAREKLRGNERDEN